MKVKINGIVYSYYEEEEGEFEDLTISNESANLSIEPIYCPEPKIRIAIECDITRCFWLELELSKENLEEMLALLK